jgi:hypothetical protein
MPNDLAALLVESGAVPADVVERAVARQREAGGTLDTALLEAKAIPEDILLAMLSRAADLPAAPPSAWAGQDGRARRVFPSRVAERHGLAPFALDGRELSLVATYPVDVGLLDEISFMLSLHLSPHVGPEWRVRELIHRLYGSALSPRLHALAVAAGAPPRPRIPLTTPLPRASAPTTTAAALAAGFQRDDSEPLEPLAAALAQALESEEFSFEETDQEAVPAAEEPEQVTLADADAGAAPEEPAPAPEPEPAPEEPPPALDRSAPPRWTLDRAREVLGQARHRDEIVLTALRYARDFFEFAAMFAVTRDAVAGHDALGVEEARDRARTVAIWSNDPGIFKTVIDTQSPYLGPVVAGAAGTDTVLHALGRTPRTVLVYPVMLRDRPVCILYADNGEAPVSARRLGDLLLFLSTMGSAFERLIRDRKKRRRGEPGPRPQASGEPGPRPQAPGPRPVEVAPAPETSSAELTRPDAPSPTEPPPAREPPPVEEPPPAEAPPPVEEPPAPPTPQPGPVDAAAEAVAPPRVESLVADWAGVPEPALEEQAAAPVSLEAPPPEEPEPTAEEAEAAPYAVWPAADVASPAAAAAAAPASASASAAPEPPPVEAPPAPAAPPPPASGDAAAASVLASEPAPPIESAPAAPPPEAAPEAAPPPPEPAAPPHPERTTSAPAVPPVAGPPDPATLGALVDRTLDADPAVAESACGALAARRRDPAMRQGTEKLRRALLSGLSTRAMRAASALGALRDVEAIPLLIQVLETSEPATAQASADALAAITLQRLGPDARKWLTWWKQNRGRGRAEWLFSGLTSPDRETRVAASVELSSVAPAPVVYTADLPVQDRERAARAWAGWWARSGHVL